MKKQRFHKTGTTKRSLLLPNLAAYATTGLAFTEGACSKVLTCVDGSSSARTTRTVPLGHEVDPYTLLRSLEWDCRDQLLPLGSARVVMSVPRMDFSEATRVDISRTSAPESLRTLTERSAVTWWRYSNPELYLSVVFSSVAAFERRVASSQAFARTLMSPFRDLAFRSALTDSTNIFHFLSDDKNSFQIRQTGAIRSTATLLQADAECLTYWTERADGISELEGIWNGIQLGQVPEISKRSEQFNVSATGVKVDDTLYVQSFLFNGMTWPIKSTSISLATGRLRSATRLSLRTEKPKSPKASRFLRASLPTSEFMEVAKALGWTRK